VSCAFLHIPTYPLGAGNNWRITSILSNMPFRGK